MELALAVLLVSSHTCVGLLALWAATSTRHWFVRTAVYLGVLSLLLLIPAREPFAIFMLQGFVVVLGVQLASYWKVRTHFSSVRWRLSLTELLLFMTLVAVAVPIGVAVFSDEWLDWNNIWQFGLPTGSVCLLSHWCYVCSEKSWKSKVRVTIPCLLLLSLLLAWLEPPLLSYILYIDGSFYVGLGPWSTGLWLAILGTIILSILLLLACPVEPGWKKCNVIAYCLLGLMGLPSGYCYYRLLTPLPIPQIELPSPNGYHDLTAAGKMADCRLINFWGETPIEQLKAGLPQYSAAYERAELGLSRSVRVPVQFDLDDLDVDSLSAARTLSRAFGARGDVYLDAGDVDEAMNDYLNIVKLGSRIRNGGVLSHWLTGTAVEDIGNSQLYQMREYMDATQCQLAIRSINQIESTTDLLENILYRDQVCSERAYGYYGRLSVILEDLVKENSWAEEQIEKVASPKQQAKRQLLLTALALRAYREVHGKLPTKLLQLVPEFLDQVPSDIFDKEEGRMLRYQTDGENYQLYSIGPNQVDDGGKIPERNEHGGSDYKTGDLLLEVVYAP